MVQCVGCRLDSLVGAREDLSVCLELSWIDAGSRGVLWWQIGGSVSRRALQFTFGCRLQVKDTLVGWGVWYILLLIMLDQR